MIQAEARAGARRHSGTDRGGHYRETIARYGTGPAREPPTHERTLGDLIDPSRPEGMRDVVNACSRDVGADVAGWTVDRLLGLLTLIHAEGRQREQSSEWR